MPSKPLRIALLLDSLSVPEWQAQIIDYIRDLPSLEIVAFVLNAESPRAKPSFLKRLKKNKFLYNRYTLWESKRVASQILCSGTRDLSSYGETVPTLQVNPRRSGFVHRFREGDINQLKDLELDIMVRFGFNILRGEILGVPQYGVWSYHHGDNDEYRGGPAGFWEVFENNDRSGVTLQILNDELDGGRILSKTEIRTDKHSPVRNRYKLFAAGIRLMEDSLHHISEFRPSPEEFFHRFSPSRKPYTKKLYRAPNNLQMILFLFGRVFPRFLYSRFLRPKIWEQWGIGISKRPKTLEDLGKPGEMKWIEPPAGHFYADPFLLEHHGEHYLVFEDYVKKLGRGRISAGLLNTKLELHDVEPVLSEEFHLAFPFLFRFRDKIFMLPEQQASGKLVLYEAMNFPYQWRKSHTIFENFQGVDPVLFEHNGQWWLFISRSDLGLGQNNLYLYSADSPFASFIPHPMSPIRNELRGSRMAGALLTIEGKLIRPGQNCSKRYGGSIVYYEITELSSQSYQEQELFEVSPRAKSPFPEKFHTYNFDGQLSAIDGSRYLRE